MAISRRVPVRDMLDVRCEIFDVRCDPKDMIMPFLDWKNSPTIRHTLGCLVTLATWLVLGTVAPARAEAERPIYDFVPADALGFVAVPNLQALDADLQQLTKLFQLPLPAPLPFLQAATGLNQGLDTAGNLLVALLPGEDPAAEPVPLVFLPVTDFAQFADSLHGDPSGAICRVTLAGEDILLARHGQYAMLMNVEHRQILELLLDLDPQPVAALQPRVPWLDANDITVTIMPTGTQRFHQLGQEISTGERRKFARQLRRPGVANVLAQLAANWNTLVQVLDWIGEEVHLISWGFSLDNDHNLRVSKHVVLHQASQLLPAKPAAAPQTSSLTAFDDQPFVAACVGNWPVAWSRLMATAGRRLVQSRPEIYGLDHLAEADWQKLESAYHDLLRSFSTSSLLMLPGQTGEPLFSNLFGVLQVAAADEFMHTCQSALESYQEIFSQSSTHTMEYNLVPKTIADRSGLELTLDVASAMRDPKVPRFNWMLEVMFGKEGLLRYLFVPTGPQTTVVGMATEAQLTSFLEQAAAAEPGSRLADNTQVQTTWAQLPAQAAAKLLVSPAGCVAWATRYANEFLIQLTDQEVNIPPFPSCPPVGIAVAGTDTSLTGSLVVPARTLQALAEYIRLVQDL